MSNVRTIVSASHSEQHISLRFNIQGRTKAMSMLELLPACIAEKSISQQEIVLPMTEALEAIDLLEA